MTTKTCICTLCKLTRHPQNCRKQLIHSITNLDNYNYPAHQIYFFSLTLKFNDLKTGKEALVVFVFVVFHLLQIISIFFNFILLGKFRSSFPKSVKKHLILYCTVSICHFFKQVLPTTGVQFRVCVCFEHIQE